MENGDVLFVHFALRSFGYMENGASTVAEALADTVLDGAGCPFDPIWSCVDPGAIFERQR